MNLITFGRAIKELQNGSKVARIGWNGKGMWLEFIPEGLMCTPLGTELPSYPYIVMKTADNKLVPWLASQTDCLATDWTIVE